MAVDRGAQRKPGRSGGGRALMLLGVILALLAGILVIYIVSQATSGQGQSEELVVATQHIPSGTVMSPSIISQDFTTKAYPIALVPAGAYVYSTQDALNVLLNQTVATTDVFPGDVLLNSDQRFAPVGTVAQGSLTAVNPRMLPPGSELFPLAYTNPSDGTRGFVVAGDRVDVIVTECGAPWVANGGCATQTMYQNLYVYATFNGSLIVVATQTQAETLKILTQTGNMTLALRKPNDGNTPPSPPVSVSSVANQFNNP